jgi:hypothetical protein
MAGLPLRGRMHVPGGLISLGWRRRLRRPVPEKGAARGTITRASHPSLYFSARRSQTFTVPSASPEAKRFVSGATARDIADSPGKVPTAEIRRRPPTRAIVPATDHTFPVCPLRTSSSPAERSVSPVEYATAPTGTSSFRVSSLGCRRSLTRTALSSPLEAS